MAFIIENGTAGIVEIGDLGITLAIGEVSDLSTRTSPQDVALSMETGEELFNLITIGEVIVKDPLDGVTNLSVADAIICLQSINDPHFRVGAGALIGDISDVDVSGLADNFILEFDSASGDWIATLNTGGTGISRAVSDVIADTGSFASVAEDTLNIIGGLGIDTSITTDVLSIDLNADLDDLTDVDTTTITPTDEAHLVFDSGTGNWEPVSPALSNPSGQMFEIVYSKLSVVTNAWIDSNGTPSNEAPLVCGFRARLAGITYTNTRVNSTTAIDIYRTAEGALASARVLVESYTITAARTARKTDYTESGGGNFVEFFEGDKISVFFTNGGGLTAPRGVTLILHFIVTSFTGAEVEDNWSGNITNP